MKKSIKEKILVLFVISLFILVSYFSKEAYALIDTNNIFDDSLGRFSYFFITALAVFIAPVSTLPLLPLAVVAWGPILASLYTIAGWTLGSGLVFFLTRKYGRKIVGEFSDIDRIESWSKILPQKNLFWSVVLLRFILPVDVLSYALGLFSNMSLGSYLLATIIGLTPFAIFFAYFSEIPIWLQIFSAILLLAIFLNIYKKMYNKIYSKL
ncbi:hypothetical protein C0584_05410 [Candidatus Parcubacteria bacterium]|nr:MAG: hypothetical protein C0584_05410 [Candidatus Parcubacteria bacterium]